MFKWAYYIFLGFIGVVVILLIVSIFPITGNFKVMIVQSGSMEPAIHTGSIVVSKPVGEYKVGDVITFGDNSRDQTPTTHRIVEIKNDNGSLSYVTKGDANNASDKNEVRSSNIIGKVWFSIPFVGYVIDFVKKPTGFILVVIVPALLVISDEIRKIWLEFRRLKNKKKTK